MKRKLAFFLVGFVMLFGLASCQSTVNSLSNKYWYGEEIETFLRNNETKKSSQVELITTQNDGEYIKSFHSESKNCWVYFVQQYNGVQVTFENIQDKKERDKIYNMSLYYNKDEIVSTFIKDAVNLDQCYFVDSYKEYIAFELQGKIYLIDENLELFPIE